MLNFQEAGQRVQVAAALPVWAYFPALGPAIRAVNYWLSASIALHNQYCQHTHPGQVSIESFRGRRSPEFQCKLLRSSQIDCVSLPHAACHTMPVSRHSSSSTTNACFCCTRSHRHVTHNCQARICEQGVNASTHE